MARAILTINASPSRRPAPCHTARVSRPRRRTQPPAPSNQLRLLQRLARWLLSCQGVHAEGAEDSGSDSEQGTGSEQGRGLA